MDFLSDPDHITLINISNLYQIPEYVGKAQALTKEASEDLEDESFADVVKREYPITTKSDVWLSAAYHAKTAEDTKYAEYIKQKIVKAAEVFGIQEDVEDIMNKIAEDKKETFIPYVVKEASDYPLAANHYKRFRPTYSKEDKIKYAMRLIKSAKDLGLKPDTQLYIDSRLGMPDFKKLGEALEQRQNADYCRGVKNSNYDLLKQALETNEFMNHWDELVGIMEELDKDSRYKNYKLASLVEAAFSVPPEDFDAELRDIQELDGEFFSLKKLAELGPDFYSDVIQEDIKSETGKISTEKLAKVLAPKKTQKLVKDKLLSLS